MGRASRGEGGEDWLQGQIPTVAMVRGRRASRSGRLAPTVDTVSFQNMTRQEVYLSAQWIYMESLPESVSYRGFVVSYAMVSSQVTVFSGEKGCRMFPYSIQESLLPTVCVIDAGLSRGTSQCFRYI